MPHLPAAILILMDQPHPDKQKVVAFAAAAAEPLTVYTLCYTWQACRSLIRNGLIAIVVCALDPGDMIRDAIEADGGRLIVVREQPDRIRRSVHRLVLRLAKRGMTPKEIAEDLEIPTRDVKRSLDRLPPRDRPSE